MADTTPDQIVHYDHDEVANVDYTPPETDWLDTPTDFRPGSWIYPAKAKHLEYLKFPNPREWSPADKDWKLPKDWKSIVLKGLKERLDKYRSLKIFMDCCVRSTATTSRWRASSSANWWAHAP